MNNFQKGFYILILGLFVNGCANQAKIENQAGIIKKETDLKEDNNSAPVVVGLSAVVRDSRIKQISGWCKNLETGEDIVCLRQDDYTSYKAKPVGRFKMLSYANVYELPIGKYELHTLNYGTKIGTSHYKHRVSDMLDTYSFKLGENAVRFEVKEEPAYLGHFNFIIGYDYLYQPVIRKLRTIDGWKGDFNSLPESVKKSSILANMKSKKPLIGKVEFEFDGFIKNGSWSAIDFHKKSLSCPNFGLYGKKTKIESNLLLIQTGINGFPTFPSKEFSELMACTLQKYMKQNSYTQFRQTSKLSREIVKGGFMGAGKYRHYKFPLEFR